MPVPTSTNATVELSSKIPAGAAAVAVVMAKGATPAGADRLSPADRAAIDALLGAKLATGRDHEVAAQAVADGASDAGAHSLFVLGVGPADRVTAQSLREAAALLAKAARRHKLRDLALIVPADLPARGTTGESTTFAAVEALATGFLLGSFQFREYKGTAGEKEDGAQGPAKKDKGDKSPVRLTLVTPSTAGQAADALERARVLAEGQNLARTIASRPGNEINPPSLAKLAQTIAKEVGLTCRVLDDAELTRLGMGGLLAVGGGSPNKPRLIALEHRPASATRSKSRASLRTQDSAPGTSSPLLLVGKSITFDTGGISIKPADKMGDMIYDKCGGMAVLGTMVALARSNFPLPVVGLLTSAENHVSGTAYRPGDIIRQYNGVTVEITNTDAEGRLVLSDAIAWGIETYKPAAVVDLATLTGGCVVALGHTQAGLFSNDDDLAAELRAAADAAGEKVWRLPVGEDQRDMLKSHHADIVNSAGRWGSPLTGAAFLTFALPDNPKVPWVHLDIAGVADTDKELPLYTKGATGFGVRTLFEWLTARAAKG